MISISSLVVIAGKSHFPQLVSCLNISCRSLLLWHTGKKKPIFTQAFAHGFTPITAENPISAPRWITSIAALRGTNLFASGSWDGQIKLWAMNQELKSFSYVDVEIPAKGFVNSLQLSSLPYETISHASLPESGEKESTNAKSEIVLVAAVGQEPRLGRWMRDKLVKNGVLVARLELDRKGKAMMI